MSEAIWAQPRSHLPASIRICDLGVPAVAKRLESELGLLKFRVQASRDPSCADWKPEQHSAVVTVGPGRTVIGYVGRDGAETADVAASDDASPDLTALATVELLRARLLHWPETGDSLDAAQKGTEGENAAATADGANASDTWSAELGPSWLILGNGFPTTAGIYGQVGLRVTHGFVVAVRGSAGFPSSSFAVEGGRMEYRIHTGTLHAQYRFTLWQDRIELRPGLGIGVARASSIAYPDSDNFLETETRQWSLFGLAQAGIGFRPFPHFVLVADAGIGLMPNTMAFQGSQRDPSIGGENSPKRFVDLPHFGTQFSAGLRAQF